MAVAVAVEDGIPEGTGGDCVRDGRVDDHRPHGDRADDEAAVDNRVSDDHVGGGRVDDDGMMGNGEDGVELEGFSHDGCNGKGGEQLDNVGVALQGVEHEGLERDVAIVGCVDINGADEERVADGPVADGAVDLEGANDGPSDDEVSDETGETGNGNGDSNKIDSKSKSVDLTAVFHTAATVAAPPTVTPRDEETLEETSPVVSQSKTELELDGAASSGALTTPESGEEAKKGGREDAVEVGEADVQAPYSMAYPAASLEEEGGGGTAVEESAIAAVDVLVPVPAGVVGEAAFSEESTDGFLGKEPPDGIVGDDAASGRGECVAGGIEELVGEHDGSGGEGLAVEAGAAEAVVRVADVAVTGEAATAAADVVDAEAATAAADVVDAEAATAAADVVDAAAATADEGEVTAADADAEGDAEEAAEDTPAAEASAGAEAEVAASAAAAAATAVVVETPEAAATAKTTSTRASAEMAEETPATTASTPAAGPTAAPGGGGKEKEKEEGAAGEKEMSPAPDLDVSVDDTPLAGGVGSDFRSAAAGLWSASDIDPVEERKGNHNDMEEGGDEMGEGVRAGDGEDGPGGSEGRNKGVGGSEALGGSSYKSQQPDARGAEAAAAGRAELQGGLAGEGRGDKEEKCGVGAIEAARLGDGSEGRAEEEGRGAGVECKEKELQEEEEEEEVVVVVVPSAKELAEKFLQVVVSGGVWLVRVGRAAGVGEDRAGGRRAGSRR